MKRLRLLITLILTAAAASSMTASAQGDTKFPERADRTFRNGDWASAQAMYGVLTERMPRNAEAYARAIISAEMNADTTFSSTMVDRAMNHGVALDSILNEVRRTTVAIGDAPLYAALLVRTQRSMPWLARALDARLLDFYVFRHDHASTLIYATKLLAGSPDDTHLLLTLARANTALGNSDEAISGYRRILQLDPRNYDALIELALLLGDVPEARDYLRRAHAIRPTPFLEKLLAE